MHSPLKRFLLILMMLVLPVQTFASAAMLGCEGSHQEMATQAMVDEAMATCHEPSQTDPKPSSHNCKHCTACHLASSLMVPDIDRLSFQTISHSVIPHADATFTGFIPESPDRPPRALLA